MSDDEVIDISYDCGWHGITVPCLCVLTEEQKVQWDAWFAQGRQDRIDDRSTTT